MTTKDEALRKALEALDSDNPDIQLRAAIIIRGVLAQHDSVQAKPEPEQEPVAWASKSIIDWLKTSSENSYAITNIMKNAQDESYVPLYTTPPQRKPLTEEELSHIYEEYHDCYGHPINANENWAYERAIEAAHGIKGEA